MWALCARHATSAASRFAAKVPFPSRSFTTSAWRNGGKTLGTRYAAAATAAAAAAATACAWFSTTANANAALCESSGQQSSLPTQGSPSPPYTSSATTTTAATTRDLEPRVISLREVRQHTDEHSLWVCYNGNVYDITGWLGEHPGGNETLLAAGGQDLKLFWDKYHVHYKSPLALETLEKYKIGVLSSFDAELLAGETAAGGDLNVIPVHHRNYNQSAEITSPWFRRTGRTARIAALCCVGPIFDLVSLVLRSMAYLGLRRIARFWASFLPYAVRGLNDAAPLDPVVDAKSGKRAKIAVIGGGIAGVGCAYSLKNSGYDVTIYEAREVLGGNAQTATFPVGPNGTGVTQDLSVLFWAPEYYKNYCAFLQRLGVTPAEVRVKYLLHTQRLHQRQLEHEALMAEEQQQQEAGHTPSTTDTAAVAAAAGAPAAASGGASSGAAGKLHEDQGGVYYAPPDAPDDPQPVASKMQPSLAKHFEHDFKAFDEMLAVVRACNRWFTGNSQQQPSFYHNVTLLSRLNPLNYIGIRSFCRASGISDEFYETVLNPFHGIQLTISDIGGIPACALEILDDIVPLTRSRTHQSWGVGNSALVFQKATEGCRVKLNARVRQVLVEENAPSSSSAAATDSASAFASSSSSANGSASSSSSSRSAAAAAKPSSSSPAPAPTLVVRDQTGAEERFDRVVFACNAHAASNILKSRNWIETWLLEGVGYHDDTTHADWAEWLECPVHSDASVLPNTNNLRDTILKNYAFVIDVDKTGHIQYDHNLGSWSPSAKAAGAPPGAPMLMTCTMHPHKHVDPAKQIRTFSAPRAHPDLSVQNMVVTQLLHLIQGRNGVYFCSNWTAPGNGHDLSLTSGLAVASAIGAEYPFSYNVEAHKDFVRAKKFMNL